MSLLRPCLKVSSLDETHAATRALYVAGYTCNTWADAAGINGRLTEIADSSKVYGVYLAGRKICFVWRSGDVEMKELELTPVNSIGHMLRYLRTRPS